MLDGLGNPVPEGVAGEIYIGGAGVARGYWKRADLTAERFIASPFVAGDRLYRTGDLGRYLPDGNIEFLGRNDFQVKIRGFRIELGEIEARLSSYPGIREAVVVAREDGGGDKRLVGYYTVGPVIGSDGQATVLEDIGASELRAYLSLNLPEYMVPAAYVRLEALPLTANGKLDRKALPAPEGDAYGRGVYEAPVGPVETKLAEIWARSWGLSGLAGMTASLTSAVIPCWRSGFWNGCGSAGFESDVRALFGSPYCRICRDGGGWRCCCTAGA